MTETALTNEDVFNVGFDITNRAHENGTCFAAIFTAMAERGGLTPREHDDLDAIAPMVVGGFWVETHTDDDRLHTCTTDLTGTVINAALTAYANCSLLEDEYVFYDTLIDAA